MQIRSDLEPYISSMQNRNSVAQGEKERERLAIKLKINTPLFDRAKKNRLSKKTSNGTRNGNQSSPLDVSFDTREIQGSE